MEPSGCKGRGVEWNSFGYRVGMFCFLLRSYFSFYFWILTACFRIALFASIFRMQSLKIYSGRTEFSSSYLPFGSYVKWALFRYSMCLSYAALAVFCTMFSILFSPITFYLWRIFKFDSLRDNFVGEWTIVLLGSCEDSLLLNFCIIFDLMFMSEAARDKLATFSSYFLVLRLF